MTQTIRKCIVHIVLTLLLTSCVYFEKTKATIPTVSIPMRSASEIKRMVIVLPGRGDTLEDLEQSGIASVIQQRMPDTDVLLVELTLPYYIEGRAPQRLHEQIVRAAKKGGYREIYLAGASMGGMGVLAYEREYPNQMSGLILMAPNMGDSDLIEEIKAAGGVARWNAGPIPEQITSDNVTREQWRQVQSWINNRERSRQVWLICGKSDRFHAAAPFIAQILPPGHYVEPAGGHAWAVWTDGAKEVFTKIGRASSSTSFVSGTHSDQ